MTNWNNIIPYQHEDFIKATISFIEFILINSKIQISFDSVSQLFKFFVQESHSDFEKNIFFNFLTKENDKAAVSNRKFLLDDKVRSEIFKKIFCNEALFNCEKLAF